MAIETAKDPRAFSDFEHQGWAESSSGYDALWASLTRQCANVTLDAVKLSTNMRVLDVCTGPGVIAEAATERGAEVVGLDFSEELLAIAQQRVPAAEFSPGDAQNLPFDDESFDAVVCGFGLMHLPCPDLALSEMSRILRPRGRLAVSVWDAPTPQNGLGILYNAVRVHGDLNVPLPHGPDFFQFSTIQKMTEALQSCGLQDVRVDIVPQRWDLADSSDLVRAIEKGAVRAKAVLLAQTEAAHKAIEASVGTEMLRFQSERGIFEVPMPALVGSGTK